MSYLLKTAWILFSAWSLGRCFLDLIKINSNDHWLENIFSLGTGLGIWAFIIFALGNSGLLYSQAGYVLLSLSSILGLALIWLRPYQTPITVSKIKGMTFTEAVLLAAFLFLLILNISGALTPELRQDSLQYHVTVPHLYLQNHQVFDIPYLAYHFYSLNMEMIYTLGMMLDGTIIPKLIHLSLGFMCALVLWRICRLHSPEDRIYPLLAAFLFYSLPQSGWMASAAFNENGWMFFGLLAFIAWLGWDYNHQSRWLCFAALLAGMGMSIKMISFAFYPFMIGSWSLYYLIKRHDTAYYKCWVPCAIILFLPLIPWFIRNFVYTGNPVFPLLGNIFPCYPDYLQAGINFSNIRHMQSFSILNFPFQSMEVFSGILINGNWMIALFGVCFLVGLCFWKKLSPLTRKAGLWGIYAWVIYLVLEGGLDGRFLYPSYPVMAFFCAMVIKEAVSYSPGIQGALILLLAVSLSGFSVFGRLGYSQDLNESLLPVLTFPEKDAYLERLPVYPAFRYINTQLPADARILLPASYAGVYCERHYMSNSEFDPSLLASVVLKAQSTAEITRKLDDMKVNYVVLPSAVYISQARYPVLAEFLAHSGKILYQDTSFILIQVKPAPIE